MARIEAFECDVCAKITKAVKCSCCSEINALPDDWIVLRKLNADLPALTDKEDEDRYEYFFACSNEICQQFLRDNSGAQEPTGDSEDEARPRKPESGAVN